MVLGIELPSWTDIRNTAEDVIGGAAVGMAIAGPAGAVVGGVAGGAKAASDMLGSNTPPAPVAPPKPPNMADAASSPQINQAEKKQDEEGSHGAAANILAGGMYQAPPMLAKNILLGN